MRGKIVVMGAVVLASLSGCAAATGASTSAATTGASAKPVVTGSPATVIPVALPKAHTGAPGLSQTGTNWKSIMTSLTGYGSWLLANPDPSMVGNVTQSGCPAGALLGQQVNGLINSNAYIRTIAPVITSVVGPSASTDTTAGLTVVASRVAEPMLTQAKNETITTIPAYPSTTFTVTLNQGTDKKWRLCTVSGTLF